MLNYLWNEPKKPTSVYRFKEEFEFKDRYKLANKIKSQDPNNIPIIIEKDHQTEEFEITIRKFVLNKKMTVAQLIRLLFDKKIVVLDFSNSIILYINSSQGDKDNSFIVPRNDENLGNLYDKYKYKDGFLYIKICANQTFG